MIFPTTILEQKFQSREE